jgi:hypothetical protein
MIDFAQPPRWKGPPCLTNNDRSADDTRHPLAPRLTFQPPLPPILQGCGMDNSASGENKAPPPWSTAGISSWPTVIRPLSDIRELTEPSLAELTNRYHDKSRRLSLSRQGSINRKDSIGRQGSISRKNSLRESIK